MSKKKSHLVLALSLVIISALAYFNSLGGDFVWDDQELIKGNQLIMTGDPLDLFAGPFFPQSAGDNPGYYRPVTMLTYWLDRAVWRANPYGFHLTNVLLNIICVLLAYLLFTKFIKLPSRGWAWLGAALFALHPYHTESVSFISGRTDILATIFLLAAFMLYILHRKEKRVPPLYLAILAFALGILSKEVALALIPIIAVWELFINREGSLRKATVTLSPFLVTAIAYIPVRLLILGGADKILTGQSSVAGPGVRLFYSIYFLAKYIYMLVLPLRFDAYRLVQFFRIGFGYREVIGFVISGGFIGLLWALYRAKKYKEVFWGGFLISGLLPVLNIVQIPGASAAERFLYLPSIGFCALLASGLYYLNRILRRRFPKTSITALIALAILLFYGSSTVIRNYSWKNELLVYRDLIHKDPYSIPGHSNLAVLYLGMGEYDSTIIHAHIAISRSHDNPVAWLAMGKAYGRLERYGSADYAFRKAATYSRNPAEVLYAKANMELSRGNTTEAEKILREGLEANPEHHWSHFLLGKILLEKGQYRKALQSALAAKRLDPDEPVFYKLLSEIYVALGENLKATESWKEYLRLPGIKIGEMTGEESAPGVIPGKPSEKEGGE